MKIKKSVVLTVAVSCAGLVALALSGCEWFSFEKEPTSISDTLGFENDTAAWLTSSTDVNRQDAYQSYQSAYSSYQSALASGEIDGSVSFYEYLKAMNDDSAALTAGLRSSVAIVTSNAQGSGVIYSLERSGDGSATAYVITNYHVVNGGGSISRNYYTYLYGDKYDTQNLTDSPMTATYVGGCIEQDIAVLSMEIPADRLDFVQPVSRTGGTRNSDYVNVGEKVYAIGNLLGNGISVVSGVVSVEAEYNQFQILDNSSEEEILTMRIDAPVTYGNSGGGLFDVNGKFLGIVNGGRTHADNNGETIDVDGYGFAIPANRVVSVVQNIIDNSEEGRACYGRLGTLDIVSSAGVFDSETQTIDIVEKIVVTAVDGKSPFASSDIEGKAIKNIVVRNSAGDITVSQKIVRKHQIESILYNLRLGDTVTLTFEDDTSVNGTYDNYARHFCRA